MNTEGMRRCSCSDISKQYKQNKMATNSEKMELMSKVLTSIEELKKESNMDIRGLKLKIKTTDSMCTLSMGIKSSMTIRHFISGKTKNFKEVICSMWKELTKGPSTNPA